MLKMIEVHTFKRVQHRIWHTDMSLEAHSEHIKVHSEIRVKNVTPSKILLCCSVNGIATVRSNPKVRWRGSVCVWVKRVFLLQLHQREPCVCVFCHPCSDQCLWSTKLASVLCVFSSVSAYFQLQEDNLINRETEICLAVGNWWILKKTYSFVGLWFWTPIEQRDTIDRMIKSVELQRTVTHAPCLPCIFCILS